MKEAVPIEDLNKKGFCLLISFWDNGRQMQNLAEALREYSDYHALHVNAVKASPMLYDSDVWLKEIDTPAKRIALQNRVREADFFIFSEFLPNSPQMRQILNFLGLYDRVNPNNTIIRTGGSVVAYNTEHYLLEQIRHGWMYAGGFHDFSISSKIGLVAPTRNICPIDKLPKPNPPEDKIRVCFAPTKEVKGVKPFTRVMKQITKEHADVEFVPITNKTWKESVKMKSECQITLDQFWIPTYANSAIESMYLKHVVISRIDLWTSLLFPDLPIVNVWSEEDVYKSLKYLLDDPEAIRDLGEKGHKFVLANHSPKVVVEQWLKLIKFVKEGRSTRWEKND